MRKIRNLLIALLLVLFAVPMFAGCANGDGIPDNAIKITNADELINAINNQAENQYWVLNAGTYDIDPNATTVEYSDQTGWYLPIVAKGITIRGKGEVVLTSTVESVNGAWASQNFITIVADNVTIIDVKVICKKDVNKAVEILGKNATLKNVTFDAPEGFKFAGSIYLNQQKGDAEADGDVGTLTLENVILNKGRITASGAKQGKIVFNNVTIDWTDIEEDYLTLYAMYNFNGKDFEYEGAKTVKVKLSETELGKNYQDAQEILIADVVIVNVD